MVSCLQVLAMEATSTEKFQAISLQTVEMKDLCTGKIEQIPENAKVDLWSFHCGNCREKIEDLNGFGMILVNVDESSDEKSEACVWIKSKHLKSLSDAKNLIKSQMGGAYPLPTELLITNRRIGRVHIGYWRTRQGTSRSE
jgi:hypothetical protein